MSHQALDPKAVPKDRLSTTDERGSRVYLYPSEVRGHYKSRRVLFQTLLLFVFLALPWVRLGGRQALLLDVAERKFSVFGLLFWAHDAPMLLFLLGGFALSLAFATSVWGRVWCGWACPQTVFIERVFRQIEKWVEGDSVTRRRRDTGPFSWDYAWRKGAKWAGFLGASLIITHSFLAYFVGSDKILGMMTRAPSENWGSFMVILVTTAIILFDFGWFREQFCIVACPYGRFQSVLLDSKSMIVAYDSKRGEPRGKGEGVRGDCVDCSRCIQVCPTGIDIRRGQQMECVACTACMDACDDVMSRLHKPKGLIRYTSLAQLTQGLSAATRITPLRPRSAIYLLLIALLAGGLVYRVRTRGALEHLWVRAVGAPYQVVGEGAQALVLNRFEVDLGSQVFDEDLEVRFSVLGSEEPALEIATAQNPLTLRAGEHRRVDLFFKFPRTRLSEGRGEARVEISARGAHQDFREVQQIKLVGPFGPSGH